MNSCDGCQQVDPCVRLRTCVVCVKCVLECVACVECVLECVVCVLECVVCGLCGVFGVCGVCGLCGVFGLCIGVCGLVSSLICCPQIRL